MMIIPKLYGNWRLLGILGIIACFSTTVIFLCEHYGAFQDKANSTQPVTRPELLIFTDFGSVHSIAWTERPIQVRGVGTELNKTSRLRGKERCPGAWQLVWKIIQSFRTNLCKIICNHVSIWFVWCNQLWGKNVLFRKYDLYLYVDGPLRLQCANNKFDSSMYANPLHWCRKWDGVFAYRGAHWTPEPGVYFTKTYCTVLRAQSPNGNPLLLSIKKATEASTKKAGDNTHPLRKVPGSDWDIGWLILGEECWEEIRWDC